MEQGMGKGPKGNSQKDTYERSADARASVSRELNGILSPSEMAAAQDAMAYIKSIESNPRQSVTPEQAIDAEAKAHDILSKHEAERFEKLVRDLDPSFDALDNAAKDFNKKAEELGVTKILNNKEMSLEQKDKQITKIFDNNPEFRASRENLIRSQDRYRKVTNGIHGVLNRFNEKALERANFNKESQQELADKLNRTPTEPQSGISRAVDAAMKGIYDLIKNVFKTAAYIGKQFKKEVTGDQKAPRQPSGPSGPK